jgi:tetratricopeptide (TPR) repeat protein
MDPLTLGGTVIGILAAVAGIVAAVVQVREYLEKRRKKPDGSDLEVRPLTPPPAPQVPHNLPPRREFVGREAEKARVHEALRSRYPLTSIDGIGGIGKTVLALEVAHECLHTSMGKGTAEGIATFDGFIWTTAKDRDLTLNALLDAVARTLDYPGIAQQPVEEKRDAARKLLQGKQYLLIVDNFETITDEGVRDFLLKLPESSKALITTREQKLRQVWAISLKGLAELEALALIRTAGKRLGLMALERGDDGTLLHLYEATGGAPLAIKWAVGQIKQRGQSLNTVLAALHEARGSVFDNIFTRSWGLLSTDARQVLIVMSLFVTSASRTGIEAASDVHHFALDEALGQLVEMSLVDATDELDLALRRYSIHPLTRAFATAKLQGEAETRAFERILAYYQRFVTPAKKLQVDVPYWDYLLFDREWGQRLNLEWDNLHSVIRRALDEGRDAAALGLFLPIVHFLNVWGRWDDRLRLSREMCQAGNRLGDPSEAWLWIDAIGHILSQQHQVLKWEEALRKGRAVAEQFDLTDALTLTDAYEAMLYSQMGEKSRAAQRIESVLEQVDVDSALECGQVHRIVAARAFAIAGGLYQSEGRLAHAKELFERELEIRQSIGENPAPVLARLGHLSLRLHDVALAEEFLSQALETAGPKDVALVNYGLARVARRKGEVQEAWRLCELALQQYTRLGRERGVQRCQKFLDRLPLHTVEPAGHTERVERDQANER